MLAGVHIVAHQQDSAACGKHKGQADACFLDVGQTIFDPGQQPRAAQRAGGGDRLHQQRLPGQIEQPCKDHTQSGDLRDGKIGEDHAALQHLHAERNVRCQHQQTRDERGQQDTQLDVVHFSPASNR